MTQILRIWWPILLAMLLVQMGNGLAGTLVSVTGQSQHLPPLIQGLILSAFFAGSLAGAFSAPHLIMRTSHIRSASIYTIAMALSTASFALTSDPWVWVALRLVAGAAITGIFATVESWLNLGIRDKIRARVFGLYIFIQLGGLAAGQMLLSARSIGETGLFMFAASVIGLAALCFRMERVQNPALESTIHLSIGELSMRAPLGILCICLSGFAWAGLMASGPALVEMMGLSDFDKSIFLALAVVSGMAAQLPAGWLADHMDRRIVLIALTVAAAASALAASFNPDRWMLFTFAVTFGAATFPLYAVGVARVSEVLNQAERTSASALMIVFFDFGAIAAPMLMSYATAQSGATAYFIALAVPQILFAACVVVFAFQLNGRGD
ncbi:MAG: MFS transporter [Micropepsaceae bacterium]